MTNFNKLTLTLTHEDRVAHLTLSSPENLNAMDLAMAESFKAATRHLEGLEQIRAVVIKGQGRAFSAGGDLAMLKRKASESVEKNRADMRDFYASFLGLRDLNVPLVCALHGHVVGAGFCFAAACDIRLAADTVLLAAPFTRLALHPGMGGSYFLPRAFGESVAKELMLSGRRMDAQEALQRGFLSAVTEPEELSEALEKFLQNLLKSAPMATRAMIGNERLSHREGLERALATEANEQALCYNRDEFLVGVEALMNKQSPPWV